MAQEALKRYAQHGIVETVDGLLTNALPRSGQRAKRRIERIAMDPIGEAYKEVKRLVTPRARGVDRASNYVPWHMQRELGPSRRHGPKRRIAPRRLTAARRIPWYLGLRTPKRRRRHRRRFRFRRTRIRRTRWAPRRRHIRRRRSRW